MSAKPKRASRAKKVVVVPEPTIEENVLHVIVDEPPLQITEEDVSIQLDKIKYVEDTIQNDTVADTVTIVDTNVASAVEDPNSKKRGRKPRGGKIVHQVAASNENENSKPNVILHLRCFIKDLKIKQETTIDSYNFSSDSSCFWANSTPTADTLYQADNYMNVNSNMNDNKSIFISNTTVDQDSTCTVNNEKDVELKEIWKKLKQLEHSLHVNNVSDKKSACFWCTHDFDNPPIYIPKYFLKNSYHVYGCFCSPECAVAHLMNEHIDSSSKFERYHLLNHIYAKIYDYKKNIKPAPNPYYMLEKYYGNMTIQEYRALLSNERLFLIVDKPLTRIMPELHQDNEEHIINNRKIIASNNQNTKKKVQRKVQTKSSIVNEKFGMASASASASASQ